MNQLFLTLPTVSNKKFCSTPRFCEQTSVIPTVPDNVLCCWQRWRLRGRRQWERRSFSCSSLWRCLERRRSRRNRNGAAMTCDCSWHFLKARTSSSKQISFMNICSICRKVFVSRVASLSYFTQLCLSSCDQGLYEVLVSKIKERANRSVFCLKLLRQAKRSKTLDIAT